MKKSLISYVAGRRWLTALSLALALPAAAQSIDGPSSTEPTGASPSSLFRERVLHKPPVLTGTGDEAIRNTQAFIDWASFSTTDEREDARRALVEASRNPDIVKAFCDAAYKTQGEDYTRSLVALALLGEMRSAQGESCLWGFVNQPLPTTGTLVEGELIEQTQLAMLEAQAVQGLAYLGSSTSDEEVLQVVAKHPSRVVRAAAIDAYLWNHGDTSAAREQLLRYVQKDETLFVDRIRRESGEGASTFNAKLETYLKSHPEVLPPAPERGGGSGRSTKPGRTPEAPAW